MKRASCIWVLALATAGALVQAAWVLPPLPFPYDALEPTISNQTNHFHHDVHHAGYVKNLNEAVANYTSELGNLTLTELMMRVNTGQLPADIETRVRNNGGGAWNHALWWATLSPPNTTDTNPAASISPRLAAAMNASYGSVEATLERLRNVAFSHFGSGWAWLVVPFNETATNTTNQTLTANATSGRLPRVVVVSTSRQDNPIMAIMGAGRGGIPILGIDVWEHAYYLTYGPNRGAYLYDLINSGSRSPINWAAVSRNYDHVVAGDLGAVIGAESDNQTQP